jgi:3-hydroxyacyl-[acyl-carrier-protein] dehydratase
MTILEAIPHRAPFLLIDAILEIDGTRIRASRRVDPEDPVFKGHFPGRPVLPGVLICESIFQTAAVLIAHRMEGLMKDFVPVLTRMSNARFKHPVKPGDTMELEAELKEQLGNALFFSGKARVNGKLAVSVDFACAAVDPSTIA